MGCKNYIHPHHYYNPDCHDDDASENKLKNINNIKVDVICPKCCKSRPSKVSRNKFVNINNITISVDNQKVRHYC